MNEISLLQMMLEKAGYETRSYSGRGMYGKKCLGVTCGNVFKLFSDVLSAIDGCPYDMLDLNKLSSEFNTAQSDNMGMDIVVYFPDVEYFEG